MAIPFEVVIGVRDAAGQRATTGFYVQNGATLSQYNELSPQLADVVDNITEAVVESAKLNVPASVAGITNNTALDGSDVGDIGQFQFRTGENRPVKVNVPAIIPSLRATGSTDIDQAAPAVSAFTAAMLNGLSTGGGTIIPCNIAEGDITTVKYARMRFKNRGRRN